MEQKDMNEGGGEAKTIGENCRRFAASQEQRVLVSSSSQPKRLGRCRFP